MNSTIAVTLIDANQNSNSPNERAEWRLVAVSRQRSATAIAGIGRSTQRCSSDAPAVASIASTIAHWYQYSQPIVKPAHGPIPSRA